MRGGPGTYPHMPSPRRKTPSTPHLDVVVIGQLSQEIIIIKDNLERTNLNRVIIMSNKHYSNFVRPASSSNRSLPSVSVQTLNGEQAKKLYLEEVENINKSEVADTDDKPNGHISKIRIKRNFDEIDFSDKNLFLSAQNNDLNMLSLILDQYPNKINSLDDFGWSLLMIACQGNCVQVASELLKRNIDTSIRDKAGNSAQSLVIKSRNLVLADLLLSCRSDDKKVDETKSKVKNARLKEDFVCEICNKTYSDKDKHLSSTVHNFNSSKSRKIPTNYVIPQSNKGYQIMLKVGWNKDSGLGPDGTGKKYPIRAVEKMDRRGLGHVKRKKEEKSVEDTKHVNKTKRDIHRNRRMEVNFRREFY